MLTLTYVYDDVTYVSCLMLTLTYVYDDVTYVYDDVTYVSCRMLTLSCRTWSLRRMLCTLRRCVHLRVRHFPASACASACATNASHMHGHGDLHTFIHHTHTHAQFAPFQPSLCPTLPPHSPSLPLPLLSHSLHPSPGNWRLAERVISGTDNLITRPGCARADVRACVRAGGNTCVSGPDVRKCCGFQAKET
jgi:hypothetical protein